ncbi:hypothetical protein QQP08_012822, partial [Theobroma cacao]
VVIVLNSRRIRELLRHAAAWLSYQGLGDLSHVLSHGVCCSLDVCVGFI